LEAWLQQNPVQTASDIGRLEAAMDRLRTTELLIPEGSVDVVVSNCVLNLVKPEDKQKLFTEIFRVLRRGGRAVISDIVSDEDVPDHLKADPDLWSGCISGAFREDLFFEAFERAGFYGITLLERQEEPWRTVEGIEFRSVTVAAFKGKEGPCWDQKHAVVYRGPFRQVEDDDGHVLKRGIRTAVCEKTYRIYSQEPYRPHFELIPPRILIPLEEASPFPCGHGASQTLSEVEGLKRHPKETKGEDYRVTTEAKSCGTGDNTKGSCC
jgi:arsenite methyltransferase